MRAEHSNEADEPTRRARAASAGIARAFVFLDGDNRPPTQNLNRVLLLFPPWSGPCTAQAYGRCRQHRTAVGLTNASDWTSRRRATLEKAYCVDPDLGADARGHRRGRRAGARGGNQSDVAGHRVRRRPLYAWLRVHW